MNYQKKFKDETIQKINDIPEVVPPFHSSVTMSIKKGKKKMPLWKRTTIIVSSAVLGSLVLVTAIPALIVCFISFQYVSSYQTLNRNFALNELDSTYQPLNNITYPSSAKQNVSVDSRYTDAVNTFANNIYQNLNSDEANFSFAPMSLYANLSILSLGSTDASVMNQFDTLLALPEDERTSNYPSFYQNDYYATDSGTTQFYNGLFQSELFGTINEDFIAQLANYYCEAYSIDFQKQSDVAKMVSWANERMNDDQFLSIDDLPISSDTALYLLTTLTFDNKWLTEYSRSDSYQDLFYVTPSQEVEATYMRHIYWGNYYDYDSYYSFYDNYKNDMKIKYIVPKSTSDNIFNLTDGVNLFIDDNAALHSGEGIRCAVPKFSSSSSLDFVDVLTQLGYGSFFDSHTDSFGSIYEDDCLLPIYLSTCQQKNQIAFTEDGTTITSVTWSGLAAGSAAPIEGGIDVQLNQPFIYIIYDNNNLPLYVGNVTNPIQ
ncbi:MAG: serpin family protein [Bacilli bacterium]